MIDWHEILTRVNNHYRKEDYDKNMKQSFPEERNSLQQNTVLESNELDKELAQVPSPPADLPRSWNWTRWLKIYRFAFFVTLFVLWYLGRWLNIPLLAIFQGSCLVTFGIFLFLGLFLINHFQMRGYRENYSSRANRNLFQALKRYRRPKLNENFLQIFPQYVIDDNVYFLTWYVPGAGTVFSTSLKPGSEPLIFDPEGNWLDNEILFSKLSLMWMYALDFAPRSLQRKKISSHKKYRKVIPKYLAPLPGLLRHNEKRFIDQGFKQEYDLIVQGYPAMLALYRNSLDTSFKIVQWADAHGWDSMTILRYGDILQFHNKNERREELKSDFIKRHNIPAVNKAATKLVIQLTEGEQSRLFWHRKTDLILGLRNITESFSRSENKFRLDDGKWIPPKEMIESYRSRVAFARQVDEKEDKNRE